MAEARESILDAIRRRLRELKEAVEEAFAPPLQPVPIPVGGRQRRPRR
jgi:hypothetical protein